MTWDINLTTILRTLNFILINYHKYNVISILIFFTFHFLTAWVNLIFTWKMSSILWSISYKIAHKAFAVEAIFFGVNILWYFVKLQSTITFKCLHKVWAIVRKFIHRLPSFKVFHCLRNIILQVSNHTTTLTGMFRCTTLLIWFMTKLWEYCLTIFYTFSCYKLTTSSFTKVKSFGFTIVYLVPSWIFKQWKS